MTPEGKVKAKLKKRLSSIEGLYQFWPVQNGMGMPTLDCTGAYNGIAFAIEVKAGDGVPTPRQLTTMAAMEKGGVSTFLINDSIVTWDKLDQWLFEISSMPDIPIHAYTQEK